MLKRRKTANRNRHQNRKTEVFWYKNRKTDLKNGRNRKTENPNAPLWKDSKLTTTLVMEISHDVGVCLHLLHAYHHGHLLSLNTKTLSETQHPLVSHLLSQNFPSP